MQHLSMRKLSLLALLSLTLLGACGKQKPAADGAKAAPEEKSAPQEKAAPAEKGTADEKAASDEKGASEEKAGDKDEAGNADVKLGAEEIEKLGIATSAAAAVHYIPSKQGFGVVQSHDAIAQAVADVATAQAEVRQSQAVLARTTRLAGTAGAESAEAHESAVRQAAVDAAALRLAEAKSSVILGQHPPWVGQEDSKSLAELAQGRTKLLRVTFPLGVLRGAAPTSVRISRLDGAAVGETWTARPVWDAPADSGLPGRSFFALLPHTDLGEGERLLAWATGDGSKPGESGVLVPPSAIVMSDGKIWCFVERQPGVFSRAPLDISRPMADGYFVTDSIKPGDLIVTSASGLLLARQTNSSSEAE